MRDVDQLNEAYGSVEVEAVEPRMSPVDVHEQWR